MQRGVERLVAGARDGDGVGLRVGGMGERAAAGGGSEQGEKDAADGACAGAVGGH